MTTKVIIGVPAAPHRSVIEQQDRSPEGNWETTSETFVEIGKTEIVEVYIHDSRRYRVAEVRD